MTIDREYIQKRRAKVEADKRHFLAQAAACDGALFMLSEMEKHLTAEPAVPASEVDPDPKPGDNEGEAAR